MVLIHKIKKALSFIARNVLNPRFLFLYLLNYQKDGYRVSADFFEDDDVIRQIQSGRSLIRIGDGEIGLMHGKGISGSVFLQEATPVLKSGILRIIKEYSTVSPYMLAIPKKYISWSNKELKKENKLRAWLPLKITFDLIFPKEMKYADAHMFYYPNFFEDNIAPHLKGRQIILVMNKDKIASLGDTRSWELNIHFIPTQPHNAARDYVSIYNSVDSLYKKYKKENPTLIVSCGPTGKILVYEFSKRGLQGVDLGEGANVLFQEKRIDYLI